MKLALLLCIATFISLGQGCQTWPPRPPVPTGPPAPGSSCQCGVRKAKKNNNRIVGGENTARREFPWHVALVDRGDSVPWCGGTLLSTDTVLTAAHCEPRRVPSVSQFELLVGEHNRCAQDGEQRISPRKWINHPDYGRAHKFDNDFAIIKLATPVKFSTFVVPACLPSTSTNYDDVSAQVSGWGYLTESRIEKPCVLQKVHWNIDVYVYHTALQHQIIC